MLLTLSPKKNKMLFTFEKTYAALAQLVEHVICNLGVVGPNPTGSFFGEFPEWSKGTDCKSAG